VEAEKRVPFEPISFKIKLILWINKN
jgi:hypothetical protein